MGRSQTPRRAASNDNNFLRPVPAALVWVARAVAFAVRRTGRNRSLREYRRRLQTTACRLRKLLLPRVRSACRSRMSAARSSNCARSSNGVHLHFSNAARAALTARSASSNSCFRSVTDNLGRLGWINRRRQIIGPNLFASDIERMFFAEALSHFAQCALHFVLAVFVNETHKRCVSETIASCCVK